MRAASSTERPHQPVRLCDCARSRLLGAVPAAIYAVLGRVGRGQAMRIAMWKQAVSPLCVLVLVLSSCGGTDKSSGGSAGTGGAATSGAAGQSSSGASAGGSAGDAATGGKNGSGGSALGAGSGGCADCSAGSGPGGVAGSGGTPALGGASGSATGGSSNGGSSGRILSENCVKCIQVSGGAVVNACTTESQCADCMRGADCSNASADVKKRWGDACAAMRSSCNTACLLDEPKPICPPLSQ